MSARGHFRALARQAVDLPGTLAASDGGWRSPARVLDLSLGGARISTEVEVPAGAAVRISIESPRHWDPLEIEAEVAWSKVREPATELGVSFHPSSRNTLRSLLELLSDESFD
jgi:hypothetical protein